MPILVKGVVFRIEKADGGACHITEIMAYTTIIRDSDDAYVLAPLRFVQSTARSGDLSVKDYVDLVDAAVRAWTGMDAGYSRWLDNHVALGNTLYKRPVDPLADWLLAVDVPWHAHYTEMATDDESAQTLGSFWTAGVAGLAFELHGAFNFTALHDPVGELDYCTKSSTCRAANSDLLKLGFCARGLPQREKNKKEMRASAAADEHEKNGKKKRKACQHGTRRAHRERMRALYDSF